MKRILICMLGTLALAAGQTCSAQSDYPNRPIRLIVSSAAGGTGDTMARAVGKIVGEELNTNIVTDNRPGASGIIATQALVRADPDGYTLLHTSSSLATNAATGRKLPYDTMKDILPLSNLATSEGYLVLVNPGIGVTSVDQLIELARKKTLNYGTPGVGNPIHFHTESFAQRAKIKMTHVPYKGLAPGLTALISGEIQVLLAPAIATKTYIDAGRMRALASVSAKRIGALPNLPTMEELGFKGFVLVGGWQGWFAPGGTPPAILNKLHGAIKKAAADQDFRAFCRKGGYVPAGSSPAEFRKQVLSDYKRFREIAEVIGLKQD